MTYFRIPLLACALGFSLGVFLPVQTFAATYYWDSDPLQADEQNGSGTWTTAAGNQNWSENGTGTLRSWVNGAHTAQLGATAGYSNNGVGGTVTLAENIQLYSITKSGMAGLYTIEGAGFRLELVGTGAGFGNNNTAVGGELVINAEVAGTVGLNKTHNATVVLNATNSYTGGTAIGTTQTTASTSTLQIGNGGTTGTLGSGNVTFVSNGTNTAQSALAFNRSDIVTLSQELISDAVNPNKGILRQAGSGTLIVTSNNAAFAGKVEVNAGILQIGNGAAVGSLGGATGVSVAAGATLRFNRVDDITVTAPITGGGKVVKQGSGILTWAATGSSFTGGLDLAQGALRLEASNALPTAGTVNFTGTALLDLATYNQTLGNITLGDSLTGTIIGSGKLTLGANNVVLGTNDLNGTSTLDMRGLAEFEFSGAARTLTVGGRLSSGDTANTTGTGVLYLAQSNTILASALNVGTIDAGGNAHKNAGILYLGQTNTITVGTLNIGNANKNAGTVTFAPGITSGTLILRGTAANQRVNIYIGRHNSNVIEPDVSVLDVSGGTLDALVGDLVMGSSISGSTSSRARFMMGAGTLDVENMVLGRREAGSVNANNPYGTFELNGGLVIARTITFADKLDAGTTGNVQGYFNLNSGTLRARTLQAGAGTSNTTRQLNWKAGTITTYDAATDLTVSGVSTRLDGDGANRLYQVDAGRTVSVQGAIVNGAVAPTNSQVAFRKTGAGVLLLSGANTHSGITEIAEGTVRTAANNVLSDASVVAFTGSTTLDIQGNSDTVRSLSVGNGFTGVVTGSGKLTASGADMIIGANDLSSTATLNLQGLNEFVFQGAGQAFSVGGTMFSNDPAVTTGNGVLYLANTNTITAATVNVSSADAGGSNHQNAGSLYLGQENTITAGTLNVGYAYKNTGLLTFATGVTDGTVILRGRDADQRIDINVARHVSNLLEPGTSVIDFTAGTVDALVGRMLLGLNDNSGRSATARYSMGAGIFDAEEVILGRRLDVSTANGLIGASPEGRFDLRGGIAKIQTLTLADKVDSSATGNVKGIFNLESGTLQAALIQGGGGSTNVTRELNWTAGTMTNYDAATDLTVNGAVVQITGAGVRSFTVTPNRTATVNSTIVNGAGASGAAFAKQGTGTLILTAANTYTGTTQVREGTLLANNTIGSATGFGSVTVDAGAVLAGTGRLAPTGSESLSVSGTFKVGDPLETVANTLEVDLSGTTGGFVLDGILSVDLFTNIGNNSGVPTASDRLLLLGAAASDLSWSGTLHLGLNAASSLGTISIGDRWQIVDWTGVAGGVPPVAFSSIDYSEIGLDPALSFVVETDSAGLYAVVVGVPEPSRVLLLLAGLLALWGRRRR